MKDTDEIFDPMVMVAFIVIVIYISLAVPAKTDAHVEAEIKNDLSYMRAQELSLSIARNTWDDVGGRTFFQALVLYHSLEYGDSIEHEGSTFRKNNEMKKLLKSKIESLRTAQTRNGVALIDNLYVEGFEGGEKTYGVTLPIPDAQGNVKEVKVWG